MDKAAVELIKAGGDDAGFDNLQVRHGVRRNQRRRLLDHLDHGRTIALDPDAARAALFTDAQLHLTAIHAEDRVEVFGHFFRFANNVVTNERAAEAILAHIREAAVDHLPIKEKGLNGNSGG